MPDEKKNVYLTIHKSFVREGIEYEGGTFNSVTLPGGTVINGRDVSYYQFSPLYINASRRGEDWRDIPLLKDREVWLRKALLDDQGSPILDEEGHRRYDTSKAQSTSRGKSIWTPLRAAAFATAPAPPDAAWIPSVGTKGNEAGIWRKRTFRFRRRKCLEESSST